MFTSQTVFVVGAGASAEFNLPTGKELTKIIQRLLDIRFRGIDELFSGDRVIAAALRQKSREQSSGGDMNSYLQSAWSIRDAMPQAISIDNFIDSRNDEPNIALCGKLAICRSILDAESRSNLRSERKPELHRDSLKFDGLDNIWISQFFRMLTENVRRGDMDQIFENISFVVFNYDRSIEHYLYYALQNYYGITGEKSAKIMESLRIFHPYGTVGSLPWQNGPSPADYGSESPNTPLLRLAEEIKTFTEGAEEGRASEIRTVISGSEKIVFLGFAFHNLNMEILGIGDLISQQTVIATAVGISNSDIEKIKTQFFSPVSKGVHDDPVLHFRPDLKCNDIFGEFWRTISE